jgi:hypothetical protein
MTTADHFEVFGDATFVDADARFGDATFVGEGDRFGDVLAEPYRRDRVLLSLVALAPIPPSELPAFELPAYEPTAADLLAIETEEDEDQLDDLLAAANTLSALEARHRDLLRLRAGLVDEPDGIGLERAA